MGRCFSWLSPYIIEAPRAAAGNFRQGYGCHGHCQPSHNSGDIKGGNFAFDFQANLYLSTRGIYIYWSVNLISLSLSTRIRDTA